MEGMGMKEYQCDITIGLEASNEEVAENRAERLAEAAINGVQTVKAQWYGDLEYDTEVEEV
jgi:hypothetical protein